MQGLGLSVRVVSVQHGSQRVGLTMLSPSWVSAVANVSADEWLNATVVAVNKYGLRVLARRTVNDTRVLGIVHVLEVSEKLVSDLEEEFAPGMDVKVRLIDLDKDQQQASFSMVEPRDLSAFADVPAGEWLLATVVDTHEHFLLVSVVPPGGSDAVQGIVEANEIRWGYVESAAEEAEVGQEVSVRVKHARGRLELSMKEMPDLSVFEAIEGTPWLRGTVQEACAAGLYIEVEPPGEGQPQLGFVPAQDIRHGFVEDPEEEAYAGEEMRVRLRRVDTEQGMLMLSMKVQLDASGFANISSETWLKATVLGTHASGLHVMVRPPTGAGQHGLVDESELADDRGEGIKVGQQVDVRVLRANEAESHLELSMRPAEKPQEELERG